MIYKPIFNLSTCSWCTIFVEAGLKIWQEAFLLSCSFQCCNVILHNWRFLGGFLTFFLKLKPFSKTCLCLAFHSSHRWTDNPKAWLLLCLEVYKLMSSCAAAWKFIFRFSYKGFMSLVMYGSWSFHLEENFRSSLIQWQYTSTLCRWRYFVLLPGSLHFFSRDKRNVYDYLLNFLLGGH